MAVNSLLYLSAKSLMNKKNTKINSTRKNITIRTPNTSVTINRRLILDHVKRSPKTFLKYQRGKFGNYEKYWIEFTINGQKYAWYSDNILASIGRSKVYTIKRVRKSDIFTKQNRQKLPYL